MSKTLLQENETMAVARYVRMGPNKVRRVLRQITGKSYSEALLLLEFLPYKSCDPIIKVLRSYTDDNFVSVKQNKHIKVEGTYNGVLRSFHLSITPSKNYDANVSITFSVI